MIHQNIHSHEETVMLNKYEPSTYPPSHFPRLPYFHQLTFQVPHQYSQSTKTLSARKTTSTYTKLGLIPKLNILSIMSSDLIPDLQSLLEDLNTELVNLNDIVPTDKKRNFSIRATETCLQHADAIKIDRAHYNDHAKAIRDRINVIIPDLEYLREAAQGNVRKPTECNDSRLKELVDEL